MIYLDYNSTTPVDPRVVEGMLPYFSQVFGNAASRHHAVGREASQAVERARAQVARVLGADPREIVFTSGATESNNLALLGVMQSEIHRRRGSHVITAVTEHKAVLDPCHRLEALGCEVTYLPVDSRGQLDLDEFTAAFRDTTVLVSLMHANNETGLLHPLQAIGERCRARGVLFHTDATQSFGKEPLDVERACIDLLSISAHKVYGPKGVGGLYVRRRRPRVRCEPQQHGGGHERGMRSGTLNVPGIVGFGLAAELAQAERDPEQRRIRAQRDRLQHGLEAALRDVVIHGDPVARLAGTLSLSVAGTVAESLIRRLPDLAVATASACTSASLQPSYVLAALGLRAELLDASLRISLGRFTTDAEVERAISLLVEAVGTERSDPGGAVPSC